MDEAAPTKDFAVPPSSSTNSSGYFDCNICLDFARDPVVTLCGHLYCCPCINKWLLLEDDNISPQSCPVCKASLSQDSLVHLYGRGTLAKRQQHRDRRKLHRGDEFVSSALPRPQLMASMAGGVLGEMAVAAAMTGGLYYSSRYRRVEGAGGGRSPRVRRQEMEVERRLNQIWLFMLCCAVFCLLLF